jgi:CMP-N-acetylneuraminic acid synthetase
MRILAIIPARGGSKRLPDKNHRDFCGLPLVAWSIRFARQYPGFARVFLSTDSEAIAQVGRDEGLEIPHLRPAELSGDHASSASVALHVVDHLAQAGEQFDALALLQPTSPVRLAKRWDAGVDLLQNGLAEAAVGVAPAQSHPLHTFSLGTDGQQLSPYAPSQADWRTIRTQDLPPAYAISGNLYLISVASFRSTGTFFPPRTSGVVCDEPCEGMDIDTEADWVVAEALARFYKQEPCPRS